MNRTTLGHTLLAARAERVSELAALYGALERAALGDRSDDAPAKAAHAALCAAIDAWKRADAEAERADTVALPAAESAALRDQVVRASRHGDAALREDLARAVEPASLELPRATLARVRRALGRLKQQEALRSPGFILMEEAIVLLRLLSPAAGAGDEPPPFLPERAFEPVFRAALSAALVRAPGEDDARDLGLGAAIEQSRVLFARKLDPDALEAAWRAKAADDHPFARAPFVPRGRFASPASRKVVRCDLDGTGPVGWAAGGDVAALAGELRALAPKEPALGGALGAAAQRVEACAREGHAVIGFVEVVAPEAEGHRVFVGARGGA